MATSNSGSATTAAGGVDSGAAASSPPGGGGFYQDDDYGQDSTKLMTKSPRSLYADYLTQSIPASNKKELPKFSANEALYSSTAALLKKTRAEVEEYGKDLGVVHAIMDIPVSSDVRRTVAKIFADPKNAEAISDAEWKRREQAYQLNREVLGEKINEHLRREREVMHKELQTLTK